MAECKSCGKHFHACSSCLLTGHEWDYCSETCWETSDTKINLDKFVLTLTPEQMILLLNVSDVDLWEALEKRLKEESEK